MLAPLKGVSMSKDTTALLSDSSLLIIQDNHGNVQVFDTKKSIKLYDIKRRGSIGRSEFSRIDSNTYQVSLICPLPSGSGLAWSRYEISRYLIKLKGNGYSFFQAELEAEFPELSKEEISAVLSQSQNLRSHSLVQATWPDNPDRWANDSYVINTGMLALGILNRNEDCLIRFRQIESQCTGGEGCESYYGLRQILLFKGYDVRN